MVQIPDLDKLKLATGPSLILLAIMISPVLQLGSIVLLILGFIFLGLELKKKGLSQTFKRVPIAYLIAAIACFIMIIIVAPDPITNAANDAGSGIGRFFGNIWDGIASAFGGLRDGFVETMEGIYDFLDNIKWYIVIGIVVIGATIYLLFWQLLPRLRGHK